MTVFQTLGLLWVVFTSAVAHIAILILAYRQLRQLEWHVRRGRAEEYKDVLEMSRLKNNLNVHQ